MADECWPMDPAREVEAERTRKAGEGSDVVQAWSRKDNTSSAEDASVSEDVKTPTEVADASHLESGGDDETQLCPRMAIIVPRRPPLPFVRNNQQKQ